VVLDDYLVVNTSAGLRLTNMLSLKGRIENLFDTDYQLVHGYPMPGITFRLGLTATL
jgi:outer membrane cobalamin receptor